MNSRTPNQLVEALYEIFSRYRLTPPMEVCRCPACVGPETEKALLSTPLKKLTPALLSEFTNSAHVPGSEVEMKYFLPRYIEVLLQGEPTSSLGWECSLNRLGDFAWTQWPDKERKLVEAALTTVVEQALNPETNLGKVDLEDVLVMIARAGGKPAQILREVLKSGNEAYLLRASELDLRIKKDRMQNEFWPENLVESRELRKLLGELDLDINALIRE